MEKKRVGVITFHNYDNYGAILQSYALQKRLRELGTYPEIIDYRCDYISNPPKVQFRLPLPAHPQEILCFHHQSAEMCPVIPSDGVWH